MSWRHTFPSTGQAKNDYSAADSKESDLSSSTSPNPRLFFDKGTIRIENSRLVRIPGTKYDERTKSLRSPGLNYSEIVEYLKKSDLNFVDDVPDFIPSPVFQIRGLELRDYQRQAMQNWEKASMKGCVILPTGAGKTALGIKAIQSVNASALVVVPTIDLMEQWAENISRYLLTDNVDNQNPQGIPVGRLGGGEDDLQAITIATYDSAYIRASTIGNQFKLVIFDEVHHLPAPGYRSIAEQLVAPCRLGLTATIEREDELHELIPYLTGGVVFRLGPGALKTEASGRVHHRPNPGQSDSGRAKRVRGQPQPVPGKPQAVGVPNPLNVQPQAANHDVKQKQDCKGGDACKKQGKRDCTE